MPCENYARSGNWLGSRGKTGWMWTAVFDWVIACKPKAFLSEQSDNAINVNHGADLALIREKVADLYVVHVFVVPLAQYGVPSHRARLFLLGLLRTDAGAAEFVPPEAVYGEHNRFCLDDVLEADGLVPPDKWFNTKLRTMYKYVIPPFGEIQKIGRLAPGMGLSHNPHACAGRKGVSWAPTGYGGGGTVVQEGYVPNTEVKWRRKFTLREHHAIATAPQSMLPWHQQFVKSEADLIQCVNQGIPVQAMFCWMSALQRHFEKFSIRKDLNVGETSSARVSSVHHYVTTPYWNVAGSAHTVGMAPKPGYLPVVVAAAGPIDHVPSREFCEALIRDTSLAWEQPMFPTRGNHRPSLQHMPYISHAEWAQMHYIKSLCLEWALEKSSKLVYRSSQRQWKEFFDRYPHAAAFSNIHWNEDAFLRSPPWTSTQAECILLDWVYHEVGVRGNGWSSVRTKLYAVRHLHVQHGLGDILKHKPRLHQFLGALKKFKGPADAKHPVTVAMLRCIKDTLDCSTVEGAVMWAAVATGFHFMLRSAEYLAKESGGRFDLDRVLRVMDVTFYLSGVRTTAYREADEVRLVFGKQKMSGGGEVRCMRSCDSDLCVVKALAALFLCIDATDKKQALFAWPRDVCRPGSGVRYCDMLALLKHAAALCGRDITKFGTHSLRRGGASSYLAAGSTLEQVTFHGRWAPGSSAVLRYVEAGAGMLVAGHQANVLAGTVLAEVVERHPPRARLRREFEVAQCLRATLNSRA